MGMNYSKDEVVSRGSTAYTNCSVPLPLPCLYVPDELKTLSANTRQTGAVMEPHHHYTTTTTTTTTTDNTTTDFLFKGLVVRRFSPIGCHGCIANNQCYHKYHQYDDRTAIYDYDDKPVVHATYRIKSAI